MRLPGHKNLTVLFAGLMLVSVSFVSGQTTRYVDHTAGGLNNGSTWGNAHTSLFAAIDSSSSGDSILVAAGVYKPTNTTRRDSTFRVKGWQKVIGGYPNGGVGLRNWRVNQTILSGDIGTADSADNSYHVLSIISANNVIVDGFIIEGGYASADTGYHSWGGGIYMSTGWAGDTIRNCIIRKNYAKKRGGGVYVRNIKALLLNCKIYSNRTDSCGGGVYLEDDTTRVINSTFVNNISGQFGGGMYIKKSSFGADSIVNCSFTRNRAVNGGGLYNMNTGGGNPAIINTILYYDIAGNVPDTGIEISNNGGFSMPGIKSSDIMGCGGSSSWAGLSFGSDMTGNIDTFPRFFDVDGIDNIIGTADDTLKLQMGSPCYMAGTAGGSVPMTDIDSMSRGTPTIGAYQNTVMLPPGKTWENSAKDNRWATSANWFPDEMPLGKDTVIIDGAITSAACTLNVNDSITLINFVNNPGLFSFSACTLKVGKDADFSQATGINAGTGALIFGGSLNHTFKPKAGLLFPPIIMNGASNTLQIIDNPLRAKRIELNNGTLNLGYYAAKDTVEDIQVTNGTFSFGNAQLYVSDSANFRYAGWITPDAGTLIFNGAGSQKFLRCSYLFPDIIVQSSAAVSVVDTNPLSVRSLAINSGGSFTGPLSQWMYVKGSFINNGTFNHNNGHLAFDSSNGVHTINPGGSSFHNMTVGIGGSFATYLFAGGFITDTLKVDYAMMDLGSHTHTANAVINGMSGGVNFSAPCTLKISKTADFSGFDSIITGAGVIQLIAPDTQTLKLPMNDTLPAILHSGAGKLKLDYDSLVAVSFTQTAGQLDFNYRDVITTGNFRILNGNSSSLINLRGRNITTGGSAEFQGQSGSLLNLKPDSAWTIAAAGPLTADYAVIGRSTAAGTKGKASVRCVDSLNNINWWFMDSLPPDNDMTLNATVIDTNKVILYWNPSAIDSNDADSVGIWYKTSGDYPDSAYDPTALLAGKYSLNDSIDTIYGLNKSTLYYFSLMSHDSSGNWSDTATTANRSARTFNPGTKIWKGGAGNNNWSTAANWVPSGAPLLSDSVIFNSSSGSVCSLYVVDTVKCITLESGFGGTLHAGATYLLINNALSVNGGTLNATSGKIKILGNFGQAAGTFTAPSDTLFCGGYWTQTGGTFNKNGGTVVFDNSAPVQVFASNNFHKLVVAGNTVTAINHYLGVDSNVVIHSGTLTTSGVALKFYNDLSISGGSLLLSGDTLDVSGSIFINSGTLQAPNSSGSFKLGREFIKSGGMFRHNFGTVEFVGTATGRSITCADTTFNNVVINSLGGFGMWYFGAMFRADTLTMAAGRLMLGSGSAHYVKNLITTGGCINFGTTTLQISTGNADLSGLDSIGNSGTGNLEFAGPGTQLFIPKASTAHPNLHHTASGTLRLANNDLIAVSVSNSAGTLDFNGKNAATVAGGNFSVSNGTSSTLAGLAGRTISIGGIGSFSGQSGNLLNMNAASTWYLNAGGILNASYAVIGNCNASGGSTGTAAATCLNAGGNANWSFIVIDTIAPQSISFGPPDNAVSVGLNDNFVITFGEPVNKGTGNIIIARTSDNTVFETIAADNAKVTGGGTAVITINPNGTFAAKTGYYVLIDSTCFTDTAGNKYAGIYSNTAWNFTTIDVGTETPSLSLPASNAALGDTFTIGYTLPEKALAGSVKMSFTWAGGIIDFDAPHVVAFIPGYETAGFHTTVLSGNDLSMNANVDSVSSDPNDALVKYAIYTVKIEYQDSLGNAAAQATNTGVTYVGGTLGNYVNGDIMSKGDSAVIVSLTLMGGPYSEVAGVYFNLNPGSPSMDTSKALKLPYKDTSFTIYNIKDQGLWYGAWALYDSTQIVGVMKYDSVPIGNTPPVLTLPAIDTAYVDSTWTVSNCAYDLNNDTITLSLVSAPAGMTISQSTLSLAWKPTTGNIGTSQVIVSAIDGKGGIAKDTMFLIVLNINSAPVLSLPALDTAYEDTAWTITNFVSDADNDVITLTLLNAPAAMTVSQTNLSLSWKPVNSDVGTHPVTVMAVDPKNGRDTATMMLKVLNTNDPPQIDSTAIPSVAFEDSLYKAAIIVSDPDMNDSIAVFLSPALSWLKAESKVMAGGYRWLIDIRGIPGNDNIGATSVNCTMNDKSGAKVSMIITLVVNNTNDYPHIDNVTFPDTVYEDSLLQGIINVSDPDADDTVSLSFTPFIPWLKVQKSQGSTDSLWLFTISGRPGNADTGAIQFTATVRDKGGLPAAITDKIYVINTNDPPQTLLVKRNKSFGALEYIMDGQDDLDTVLTFYATVSDSAGWYDTAITNTTGRFQMYPLADGTYFFRCYAQDKDGLADPTPFSDTVRITGICTKTWADSGSWNMVSIPARSYSPDQFKQAGVIVHWDESNAADDIYKYYIREDAIREITAGKSYWTRLDSSVTIKLNRDSLYTSSCTIKLRKAEYGWNQIASPYIYPVQCNKDIDLWRWNPALRDFEMMTTNVLNPWEGYWVHTDNADSIVLVPQPAFAVKTAVTRSKTGFTDKTEWAFGIELISNVNRDADNLFGIHASAKDGFDRLDRAEPPRMGSEPYLYFAHPEWKKSIVDYASDIRQNWSEKENVFQAGIAPCSKEVAALAMHISGYESGMPVYLFINSGAGVIPYRAGTAIPLEPSAETQYRTIFATGDRNFLDRFPQKFTLNNPYPNPCRPAATIRYTLPYRWESNGWLTTEPYKVRLTIYDARGRAICELVNRKQGPGHYRVVWRGRSDTGGRTASGFYFIRLEAGNHSSVKKIIVMQ